MKPDFAITRTYEHNGFLIHEIDTDQASWQGKPWKQLSDDYKRKFENLLVLSDTKHRMKLLYKSY